LLFWSHVAPLQQGVAPIGQSAPSCKHAPLVLLVLLVLLALVLLVLLALVLLVLLALVVELLVWPLVVVEPVEVCALFDVLEVVAPPPWPWFSEPQSLTQETRTAHPPTRATAAPSLP
jgi:hypothetical protein